MIITATQTKFIDAFKQSNTYKNNFTYEGLKTLFNVLEQQEDSDTIKLDIVAIACSYAEYPSFEEAKKDIENCELVATFRDGVIVTND